MGCYRCFQADEREWNDPTDESDKKKDHITDWDMNLASPQKNAIHF